MEERYDRDTGRDSNYELRYVVNIQVNIISQLKTEKLDR